MIFIISLADLTLKIGTKLWDLGCNLTKNADLKSVSTTWMAHFCFNQTYASGQWTLIRYLKVHLFSKIKNKLENFNLFP